MNANTTGSIRTQADDAALAVIGAEVDVEVLRARGAHWSQIDKAEEWARVLRRRAASC